MMRFALSLVLSVMLMVAGHYTAQARGAHPAVDRMVICTGTAAVVVFVDANGQPTYAPHHCPDCALHALDAVADAGLGLGAAPVLTHHAAIFAPAPVVAQPLWRGMARAPPVLI